MSWAALWTASARGEAGREHDHEAEDGRDEGRDLAVLGGPVRGRVPLPGRGGGGHAGSPPRALSTMASREEPIGADGVVHRRRARITLRDTKPRFGRESGRSPGSRLERVSPEETPAARRFACGGRRLPPAAYRCGGSAGLARAPSPGAPASRFIRRVRIARGGHPITQPRHSRECPADCQSPPVARRPSTAQGPFIGAYTDNLTAFAAAPFCRITPSANPTYDGLPASGRSD